MADKELTTMILAASMQYVLEHWDEFIADVDAADDSPSFTDDEKALYRKEAEEIALALAFRSMFSGGMSVHVIHIPASGNESSDAPTVS